MGVCNPGFLVGSLGAEVNGAVARETRCTQSVTWISKCLILACKRQTGSWWRRYRGIDVTVVSGLVLTYTPTFLSQTAYEYLTVDALYPEYLVAQLLEISVTVVYKSAAKVLNNWKKDVWNIRHKKVG